MPTFEPPSDDDYTSQRFSTSFTRPRVIGEAGSKNRNLIMKPNRLPNSADNVFGAKPQHAGIGENQQRDPGAGLMSDVGGINSFSSASWADHARHMLFVAQAHGRCNRCRSTGSLF